MSDSSCKRKAVTIVADHEPIIELLPTLVQDFPAAKRHRPCSHRAHADLFACEQTTPMRSFRFDPTATGPAGQQASLERQGWAGTTRERVALVCPNDDCGGLVMEFVAASAALAGATTYQKRLCEHQFAGNRTCVGKWIRHCGIGRTATNKQRMSRCAHVQREFTDCVTEQLPEYKLNKCL
jgi:hypothetical protein